MKYTWGGADVAINRFNIYMKDLLPEVRKQLKAFLTECNDPRASRLQDDFNIANVYAIKEVNDGSDLSVGC